MEYKIRELDDFPRSQTDPSDKWQLEQLLRTMTAGGWEFVSAVPYGETRGYLFRKD
jgi:hypothetical protein